MDRITIKDIKAFGKVLEAIGKSIQERPESIAKLFSFFDLDDSNEQVDNSISNNEKIEGFNVFDVAKSNTKEEFRVILSNYNVEELKDIIRKFRLGGLQLKSKDSIIEHIVEQASKRTTDVFRNYDIEIKDQDKTT